MPAAPAPMIAASMSAGAGTAPSPGDAAAAAVAARKERRLTAFMGVRQGLEESRGNLPELPGHRNCALRACHARGPCPGRIHPITPDAATDGHRGMDARRGAQSARTGE